MWFGRKSNAFYQIWIDGARSASLITYLLIRIAEKAKFDKTIHSFKLFCKIWLKYLGIRLKKVSGFKLHTILIHEGAKYYTISYILKNLQLMTLKKATKKVINWYLRVTCDVIKENV